LPPLQGKEGGVIGNKEDIELDEKLTPGGEGG